SMFEWGAPAAPRLAETALAIARRMSTFGEGETFEWSYQMWANISGPSHANALHVHPGNLWAAGFYVDMGDDDGRDGDVGGRLYLEDPRFPLNAMHTITFRSRGADGEPQVHQAEIRASKGDLVVFPSWLRHGVRPYRGTRERISVA